MEKGSKCREEKLDGTDLRQVIKANTSSEESWGPRVPLIHRDERALDLWGPHPPNPNPSLIMRKTSDKSH